MGTAMSSAAVPAITLYCSFCGKAAAEVGKLIAGPGVYICDGCVAVCHLILDEQPVGPFREFDDMTDEEAIARMVRIADSREQVDRGVGDAVRKLRGRGITWARIGEALGMTRQSAWERYSGED